MQGLRPWQALHILVPQVLLSMLGAGPEAQNVQMPKAQTESLHQAPKSRAKSPYTKRVMSFRNAKVGSSEFLVPVHLQASLTSLCPLA